jgi:hypothetical protein
MDVCCLLGGRVGWNRESPDALLRPRHARQRVIDGILHALHRDHLRRGSPRAWPVPHLPGHRPGHNRGGGSDSGARRPLCPLPPAWRARRPTVLQGMLGWDPARVAVRVQALPPNPDDSTSNVEVPAGDVFLPCFAPSWYQQPLTTPSILRTFFRQPPTILFCLNVRTYLWGYTCRCPYPCPCPWQCPCCGDGCATATAFRHTDVDLSVPSQKKPGPTTIFAFLGYDRIRLAAVVCSQLLSSLALSRLALAFFVSASRSFVSGSRSCGSQL